MPVRDPNVERGDFLTGERVHVPAARLDRFRDLRRVARLGPLEQEVLEEVTGARDRLRLVARPGADPEPDRRRTEAGKMFGDDAQPGLEPRAADAGPGRVVVVDRSSAHEGLVIDGPSSRLDRDYRRPPPPPPPRRRPPPPLPRRSPPRSP